MTFGLQASTHQATLARANCTLLITLLELSQFFFLYPPPLSTPHSLWHPPTIFHVHGSCKWPLHFLYCTLHPHGYSVTTYLYFSIPSPIYPFPHGFLPSGKHPNTFYIHDSVSILLVCLVCFFKFS